MLEMKAGWPSGNESNAVIGSTKPDLAAQRADEILYFFGVVRQRRHHAPDRPRPGDVAGTAGDDMHVQLRHQITPNGEVQLIALCDLLPGAGDTAEFGHQLRLLCPVS